MVMARVMGKVLLRAAFVDAAVVARRCVPGTAQRLSGSAIDSRALWMGKVVPISKQASSQSAQFHCSPPHDEGASRSCSASCSGGKV